MKSPMAYVVRTVASLLLTLAVTAVQTQAVSAADLKLLFLGDNGHHAPKARAEQLIPVLAQRGIQITYTEDLKQLEPKNLKQYAGLIVYANTTELPAAQESALLEYVAQGGGFIPLHCASYCFLNSTAYIDLVGAQFKRHGGEVFATEITQPEHPIMQGFGGFSSWDETYIHTKHNERNRVVLEVRRAGGQERGNEVEPWTWIRHHGQGRVFYTAWGHDQRTWGHPGFQNLVERGIRWACGDDPAKVPAYQDSSFFPVPKMTSPRTDVAPFEFEEVGPKIPNYVAGARWGVQGDVITKMQKPLPAAESIKHYVTPENFHLELFVAEPQIQGKPIAMNWDERGRLWLCETIDYPNELMPPEQGRDRIRICEDTDGDGKADKFTIFAEQLSIPTSIEFCRGGVLVQAGVETVYLKDTDGDDRADLRKTVISGWAMGDTHGGVSNFLYGLDNRYWAMQGYNDSHPEYAGGRHRGFRQGPFNFTAIEKSGSVEVSDVEFVRSTTNNSWGLGITEEGLIFASTANRAPSFFVPIPNRYYERVKGWTPSLMADLISDTHLFKPITDKIRQVDHHGGYTAGAGHALYTARTYPKSWWNRVAFVCGPTGHLVGTFVLNREGATFRDSNTFNLIASDDEWAAPIMAEVGPDGNVWIIDWYNYIVQHNPTPQGFKTGKGNAYESDLRDKTHGRIYRLVYDGKEGQAGADKPAKLNATDAPSLVAALSHPNRLWRRHAQRLLVERGQTDVVNALIQLVSDSAVDSTGNNPGAIHALWTLKGLGALSSASSQAFAAVTQALKHPAAGVRRNAALVLPAATESVAAITTAGLLTDKDKQVQLGAVMALADQPASAVAGKALAEVSTHSDYIQDKYLHEGLICAAAMHSDSFLTALLVAQTGASKATTNDSTLMAIRVVAEHLARSDSDAKVLERLLAGFASGTPEIVEAAVEGLASGWPKDRKPKLSEESEKTLEQLVSKLSPQGRGSLVRLAKQWGSQRLEKYAGEIAGAMLATLTDKDAETKKRLSAASELISLDPTSESSVTSLIDAISPQLPPDVASSIVRSLADSTAANVSAKLVEAWPSLTPALRGDVLSVLLKRPKTTKDLLAAITGGTIAVNDLSLDQRQSLTSHPDRDVRSAAEKILASSGGLVSADRQRVLEAYKDATHNKGDLKVGKQLFTKNCGNCHKHSGEGNEIGPDLTGMAVHPKEELLVHILDPNRSVEGNFRRYTVLTSDGLVLNGMLAAESQSAIELIDAEAKRHSIARDDVEKITSTNKSLMPEGFEQQLKVPEMTDLLEFLTSKGRFVPLPLASVATAVSTKGLFSDTDDGPDRMVFRDWKPKEFEGVPFYLVDPQGKNKPNIVLLYGPLGTLPPKMPRSVSLPVNMPVKSLHLLSGVSGWGHPYDSEKTTTMIVRFRFADDEIEDHKLLNGVHFADYIRRVDVPESKFAFALQGQQIRYLSVQPKRQAIVKSVELLKGDDRTSPIVMAVTAEQVQ